MTIRGVDLSHHNGGALDFAAFKAAGYTFVYLKATEGPHFRDPTFAGRCHEAHSEGLHVGAYHFGRPGTDPVDNSLNFLAAVDGRPVDLPHALDLEVADGTGRAHVTGWAREFLPRIDRPNQPARLYSMDYWFRPGQPLANVRAPRWVARPKRRPSVAYETWQNGTVNAPGIGRADLDVFPGDLTAWLDAMGLQPLPDKPPHHKPTTRKYGYVTRGDVARSQHAEDGYADVIAFAHNPRRALSWVQVDKLNRGKPGYHAYHLHLGQRLQLRP